MRNKPGRPPIITLTTDFGLRDYFVGALKGVLLQRLPDVQLIDISHEISRHDIISGAFVINEIYPHFPGGTVHLVVIDPGVGTRRRKIVVYCENQFFVAPDNGLLSYVLNKANTRTFEVTEKSLLKFNESPTFAGRDHFAPIAAALASGTNPSALGVEIDDARKIEGLTLEKKASERVGKMVYFDHFGNAITNIKRCDLPEPFEILIAGVRLSELKQNYSEGDDAQVNLIINSSGWLEIFVPRKSAKDHLKLKLMDVVSIINTYA